MLPMPPGVRSGEARPDFRASGLSADVRSMTQAMAQESAQREEQLAHRVVAGLHADAAERGEEAARVPPSIAPAHGHGEVGRQQLLLEPLEGQPTRCKAVV